ncbi:MAG: aryl-sulfate sulfotransferase [Phycisphaerales bacterium]|nr:aryl-sulfate sulfotransferase [Phycisphaerales bacterium]
MPFRCPIAVFACFVVASAATGGSVMDGYTLFNTLQGPQAYQTTLIDNDGTIVHQWICESSVASTPYLLPGGELIRPARAPGIIYLDGAAWGGLIQRIALDGSVLWEFTFSDENNQQHHDICPMPNGNVLLVAWERKSEAEFASLGRQDLDGEVWPTQIVEVQPLSGGGSEIVWEWHLWDHLIQDVDPSLPNYGVVADHPEKFDVNAGNLHPNGGDWIHVNALDYHPELDQIVFSSNSLDEIYIIDHGTTTEEATGPAGDFLYRWGNPANYDRSGPHVLWNVHGVNWIDPGLPGEEDLLLFNNGNDDKSSDLIQFTPPLLADGTYDIDPIDPFEPVPGDYTFFYESPDFFGSHLSGVYRLPNGNTFATNGPGQEVRELNAAGEVVWQYFTSQRIMRANKYPTDILDPVCSGDMNDDGTVGVDDLLAIIGGWGSPYDVDDLLLVIQSWGECG